jgi:hypothetical protein
MRDMILGVDFDNTIVSYDRLFHRVALERGLIPCEIEESKASIRDFLRKVGNEDDWTEMQGYVYGARMAEALPFPGALECLARLAARGIRVFIISHKTRLSYRGPSYDLHESAWGWLEQNGFFDRARTGLNKDHIFFELTKEAKLERIAKTGCTHFVDDLPEFLAEPDFPPNVVRILFDPKFRLSDEPAVRRVTSWVEIEKALTFH